MELWRFVVGYEGLYEASNMGNIRSLPKLRKPEAHLMATQLRKAYYEVRISKKGVEKKRFVHRLIALAWLSNPENKPCVNHKNGNKLDNRVENLEWCTIPENNYHARENGLARKVYPQKIPTFTKPHNIKVYQFDLQWNLIGVISSITLAASSVNTGTTTIWKALNKRRPAKGYYWKSYLDEHLYSIERVCGY